MWSYDFIGSGRRYSVSTRQRRKLSLREVMRVPQGCPADGTPGLPDSVFPSSPTPAPDKQSRRVAPAVGLLPGCRANSEVGPADLEPGMCLGARMTPARTPAPEAARVGSSPAGGARPLGDRRLRMTRNSTRCPEGLCVALTPAGEAEVKPLSSCRHVPADASPSTSISQRKAP